MAKDQIGYRGLLEKAYEAIAPAAFRLVVRDAVALAAKNGLPGAHHFFISFDTRDKGVDIGDRLMDQFPEEMTIVIQHQYWDLEAEWDHFSVVLKFGGVPQQLIIPYEAITRFVDPEANAVFSMEDGDGDTGDEEPSVPSLAAKPKAVAPSKAKAQGDETADEAASTVVQLDAFRRK